jgi:hypothetical protein
MFLDFFWLVSTKVHFVKCIGMQMIHVALCLDYNLKHRSLIKWAKDGNLYMHEQLQDMGQNIVMEVTMSQFIWKLNTYLQNSHL